MMDSAHLSIFTILLVLCVRRCVHGSPVAMLQHATSSQSIVFNPIQAPSTTTVSTHSVVDEFSKAQPKYEFKYEVADHQTGDKKSHWESGDGDTVRGVYTLYEPDGALRTVEYTADALHGFNAVVKRNMVSEHKRPGLSSTHAALYPSSLTSNLGHLAENVGFSKAKYIINKGYLRPEAVYNPGVNFSVDHGKAKLIDTPFAF